MQYEIPQELKYKEKIVFNLDFEQLVYALIFTFVIIIIFKTNLGLFSKFLISSIFVVISVLFMFFNFKDVIRNYFSWINFRDVKFMTRKMNRFFALHYINSDHLEIRQYRNKFISRLRKIKSYDINKIAIIKVMPINFSVKGEDSKEHIIKNFQRFLNSLDFEIQILVKTEPLTLESYFRETSRKINPDYSDYFKHYKENIENLILEKNIQNRSFYIIIKEKDNLEIQVDICTERLRLLKLNSHTLNEKETLALLMGFFDTFQEKNYEADVSKLNYFNYLVAPNYIKNNITNLEIDNKFYTIIAAYGYPRNVQIGFLDKIITSNANFDISMHIEPFSIENTIVSINKELQKQRADLYSLKKRKILNTSLEIKYNDTKKILEELQKGTQRLFNISLYILIKASSKEELELLTKKIESELNSLLIIPRIMVFNLHKALKSMLPYSSNEINYKRNITTDALSAFFPFTSKFLDIDNNGILLGLNKNNIPIIKDIYNLGNSNGFILSSSGHGKSFYAKLFIMRQLMFKNKVIVIDPQNEYIKLAKKFNGQIINISNDSDTIINALDLMGHDYAEKRISLIDLFNVMLGGISDIQKSVVDRALTNCYLKKGITINEKTWNNKPPKLEDLLKELLIMEKKSTINERPTYHSLINRLSMYVDGVYSFLNRHTKIDFNNDFIIFNIGNMPRQVKPVIMFLILDYVYMKMKSSIEQKLLVIDEAWSLLNKVEEASYIFEIVKTSRKFNLSLLLITQDVVDLVDSKAGTAILSNSSYTVLFSHKPSAIDSIAKILHLSSYEKELLITSKIGHGLIILGDEHSELKVVSSKQEYELITTNPKELIELEKSGKLNLNETKEVKATKIKLDLDKRFYVKRKLTKEETEFLLDNNYVISSHVNLDNGRHQEYLLRPYANESSSHFFVVYITAEYIKKYTNQIKTYNTLKPDIIFKVGGKEIAIEIETGSYINKKEFQQKVANLNKNYEEWFFVLTDRNLRYNYKKFGVCFLRHEIPAKIDSYFKKAY
ncbi:ATP-binding protein [Candidatus Woesearchaeota archaeon]|nr:ATP-binding protein [Candidatus Woesearchaeota archaeon]